MGNIPGVFSQEFVQAETPDVMIQLHLGYQTHTGLGEKTPGGQSKLPGSGYC